MSVRIGAVYRHYKGGLYRVLRVKDGCVEYEKLTPEPGAFRRTIDEFTGSVRFRRTIDEFTGSVRRDNSVWVRRFELQE